MKRMASPHGFDLSSEIIGSVTSTSPRQPRPSPLPPFTNINLSTLNMYAYEYLNASGLDAWRQLCDEIRTSYVRSSAHSALVGMLALPKSFNLIWPAFRG